MPICETVSLLQLYKFSNGKVRPLEKFHRTPRIENFCSVKPCLQVNAEKPSQERFWKQKFQKRVKTKAQK